MAAQQRQRQCWQHSEQWQHSSVSSVSVLSISSDVSSGLRHSSSRDRRLHGLTPPHRKCPADEGLHDCPCISYWGVAWLPTSRHRWSGVHALLPTHHECLDACHDDPEVIGIAAQLRGARVLQNGIHLTRCTGRKAGGTALAQGQGWWSPHVAAPGGWAHSVSITPAAR